VVTAVRRLTSAALVLAALVAGVAVLPAPAASAAGTGTVEIGLYGSSDATYDGVYRQSLAVLGLRAAGRSPRPEAVRWLLAQQCADGSFPSYRSSTSGACPAFDPMTFTGGADTNATALAVQALTTVASSASLAAADRAAAYLVSVQQPDGGWEFTPGAGFGTDPNSTGLVLTALKAADVAPTRSVLPFFAALQVGRTDFATHDPSERGAISAPFALGLPNVFATVQSVPGLLEGDLTALPDTSVGWQDGATDYPTLPSADSAENIAGWAATYLAGWIAATPAAATTDTTSAAWAVLSLAWNRTSETAARALYADIRALAPDTSPATNGQNALAAAALGRIADAATYADRIEASLTRDLSGPVSDWRGSTTSLWSGQSLVLSRTSLVDNTWPAGSLTQVVSWGDGSSQPIAAATARVTHRYTTTGSRTVTVRMVDPSGNVRVRTLAPVIVRLDTGAPTVVVVAPTSPTSGRSWRAAVASAADSQSGVASVRLRLLQQRSGSWYSWTGSRWVPGTASWVPGTRVAGTSRWSAPVTTVLRGRLVVTALATDGVGHVSAAATYTTTVVR
jgi:hypothetical protein